MREHVCSYKWGEGALHWRFGFIVWDLRRTEAVRVVDLIYMPH